MKAIIMGLHDRVRDADANINVVTEAVAGMDRLAGFVLSNADELIQAQGDIERSPVPIFIFDPVSYVFLAANTAALQLYGYPADEFLQLTVLDVRPPEEIERIKTLLADPWPPGLRYTGIWRHKAKNGRNFNVTGIGMSITHEGRPAILALITDLTPGMYASGSPVESERLLFPFAEQMEFMVWIRAAEDGRLIYVNLAFEKIFGIKCEEAYADPDCVFNMVHPDDLAAVRGYREAQGPGLIEIEFRILRPDGTQRWIATRSFILRDASGEKMYAGISSDITENKQAMQQRIDDAVAQRDALVREVHHRIKNNLQGITGMLRQLATAHPELQPAMAQAIAQVQTVAVIHGLQSKTAVDRVALCELLPSIAANVESLMPGPLRFRVLVNRDHRAHVCEAEAVAVALLLNELMLNAVKHGTEQKGTAIQVVLSGEDARVEVRIVNPGRLGEDFDFAQQRGIGIGLQLVKSLLPREGARLSIVNGVDGVEALLVLEPPVVSLGPRI